jgi:hypothetical protein
VTDVASVDDATRRVPARLRAYGGGGIGLAGPDERGFGFGAAVHEPPGQFDGHGPDVRVGVVAKQAQAARQHQSLRRAARAGLTPIARQCVHSGHPDGRDRVVQHGDHLFDHVLHQEVVKQPAALLADRRIAVAQARPDRRDGLPAASQQVAVGRAGPRRAAKSAHHAFVAAVRQTQHGHHAIRAVSRPATE